MKRTMTIWGIGPFIIIPSIIYGILGYFLTKLFPVFQMNIFSCKPLLIIGTVLILTGIPFLIFSGISLVRTYKSNALITSGVYRFCRNPIYSAWIVFIIPGLGLISNSWLCLSTPVIMYLILKKMIKKEEKNLEDKFGKCYTEYKVRTPLVLPIGFVKKKHKIQE